MSHTSDYGLVPYTPMILQYYEIMDDHCFFKQQFMAPDSIDILIYTWPLLQQNIRCNGNDKLRRWR